VSQRACWRRVALSAEDGRLFLYGPFKRDGKQHRISNAVFDTSLRQRDAEWGVPISAILRSWRRMSACCCAKLYDARQQSDLVFQRSV